jgi:UDP-N-acetylmuramoyl-L-alanyl-D-glutamate--2,6-diaminopimelate ligase
MEEYARAKARLFSQAKRSFLNADDKYCDIMMQNCTNNYLCSTRSVKSDFTTRDIRFMGMSGSSYTVFTKNSAFKIDLLIPGEFSVMNSLQASACAYTDGIDQRIIRYALKSFRGVRGRLERILLPTNEFSVYIDFAHTPDALKNVLKTVRSLIGRDQRLILLFGCGGDRDKSKRSIMGRIASEMSDFVVITSDNSRSENTSDIISSILSDFDPDCPHTVIEDRKEAIEFCISNAISGDVIILAGKGHEEYQILNDGKHYFNEKKIVIDAVRREIKGRDTI